MNLPDASALLAAIPGVLRVGVVRLPLFGVIAAVGVIAALLLSQHTATIARIDPSRLWNAGMVFVLSAFVFSRIILILASPRTFTALPLAVLLLPSLSLLALALAAITTLGWLRWKKVWIADAMDAWTPCVCVLFAVLAVAHFVEGTDAGTPTRLPWAVVTPGDHVLGRVHPVQMYACIAWCVLGWLAWRRLRRRAWVGEVAAWTLAVGGVVSFLLDMLRQPVESQGSAWLDPEQYVALAAAAAGAWWLLRPWMDGPRHWSCGGVIGRDEPRSAVAQEAR